MKDPAAYRAVRKRARAGGPEARRCNGRPARRGSLRERDASGTHAPRKRRYQGRWKNESLHFALRTLVLSTVCGALALPVLAADPHIGYLYPAGARAGESTEITIGGQFIEGATNIIVSDGGIRAEIKGYSKELTRQEINRLRNKMDKLSQTGDTMEGGEQAAAESTMEEMKQALMEQGFDETGKRRIKRPDPKKQPNMQIREQVHLRLSVDPDATPGTHEIRLLTDKGLSNPMVFHVGMLPEQTEVEPNNLSPNEEVSASLPVVLNGQIMPGDVDLFHIPAKKGQRLLFRTEARSLVPYLADAVPGWFQATLAIYDPDGREVAYVDDYQFDPDPMLAFEVPEDGEYILEIKDSIYRGREDFVYRIAIQPLPEGKPARPPLAHKDVSAIREEEPNNTLEDACPVKLPATIEGNVGQPGDWDIFRFKGHAGQKIVAEVFARREGSPLDSLLKLTDSTGTFLDVNDDCKDPAAGLTTHHADSRLAFVLPADGMYAVHLGDIQNHGSADHSYRLRIAPQEPGFDLRVTPSTVNLSRGGTTPITVHALRRDGFNGDIVLSLVNAPAGFKLSGNILPAGRDTMNMTLTVPWRFSQQELTLAMTGSAVIDGKTVIREAVPAEDMMQAFLWRHLVPVKEWAVAVSKRGRGVIRTDVPEDGIVKIPAGGKADVILRTAAGKPLNPRYRFELDKPVDGLSLTKTSLQQEGTEALLAVQADSEKLMPGTRGNLIINALAPNPKRNLVLCTAPAVPFEIVEP